MVRRFTGFIVVFVLTSSFSRAAEKKPRKIDFVKEIQPILEFNCVGCHREGNEKKFSGDYRMDTKKLTFKGKREGKGIVPGDHEESTVWEFMTLPLDDDLVMPPEDKTQRPTKEEIELVAQWIDQGASWPDGLELRPRKKILRPRMRARLWRPSLTRLWLPTRRRPRKQ